MQYVLDSEAFTSNSAVTDTVKLVTVKAKPVEAPPLAPVQLPLADAEFWMVSAIILGILGFLIGSRV